MASVSLRNVSKIYPGDKGADVAAVKDFSLEVADRELVVLLGPSGCGKSTILRIITGLEQPSRGDICIGNKRVNDVASKDRDVAMLFPHDALYPQMSVYDNLAFGLKLRKFSSAEITKQVHDAGSILGIEGLLERKVRGLSADQRQRVALGRAIVRRPKVFLLDEPLSTLDSEVRGEMRTEMTKLHQRLEATMIYATDDSIEAMTLGDRIVVMSDGAVQQNDAPLVLYNQPANLFVAEFLSRPPMNFVNGTLKQEGDKIRFCESEGGTIDATFPASERPATREFIGRQVILGILPDDIEVARVSRKEGKIAGSGFAAIVDMVEPMGSETNLYLETGAHTLVCRSHEMLDRGEAGHRLQFGIDLPKAIFFDPVSRNRLT